MQNTLQIFQLLDRSNCRQCGKKSCLAFAGAVFSLGTGLARMFEKLAHRHSIA